MADNPVTVFRDYRGTKGVIEDADRAPTRIAGKREIKPGASAKGVTTAQALKSERTPKKGEGTRAFGPPLTTPKPKKKKKKKEE